MRSLSKPHPAPLSDSRPRAEVCNCLALREAARHVTRFYDRNLAPTGLRATQFAILSRLRREGRLTINALAADLVMDRTTLGRTILPLQRDGLVEVATGSPDRRRKELLLTEAGAERLVAATGVWARAQAGFEAAFGKNRAADLRGLLGAVVATDLGPKE